MKPPTIRALGPVPRALLLAGCLAGACAWLGSAAAADVKKFDLHEWAVWVADPNLAQANARDRYPNAMPTTVTSSRHSEARRDEPRISPVAVITFYGEPVGDLDLELRLPGASVLAHWPKADQSGRRLRWDKLSLAREPGDSGRMAYVGDDHWFQQARKLGALYVNHGARTERFIAYDAEVKFSLPIKIEGGPDRYRIRAAANYPLHDLVVSAPAPGGRRIGWVDLVPAAPPKAPTAKTSPAPAARPSPKAEAPKAEPKADAKPQPVPKPTPAPTQATAAAKTAEPNKSSTPEPPAAEGPPVEVTLSPPLVAGSPDLLRETTDSWRDRLRRTGLKPDEIDLILSLYAKPLFESREMTVLFRLPAATFDEQLPIDVFPAPQKTLRVALVLVRNIDPGIKDEVKGLIARLGHAKYAEREAAERRLTDLGGVAWPALKDALKNSDLEIVFRAEQILLSQRQPIDGK